MIIHSEQRKTKAPFTVTRKKEVTCDENDNRTLDVKPPTSINCELSLKNVSVSPEIFGFEYFQSFS